MSYDVYWVKNRAEKIADFEHPTLRGFSKEENSKQIISPMGFSSRARIDITNVI